MESYTCAKFHSLISFSFRVMQVVSQKLQEDDNDVIVVVYMYVLLLSIIVVPEYIFTAIFIVIRASIEQFSDALINRC